MSEMGSFSSGSLLFTKVVTPSSAKRLEGFSTTTTEFGLSTSMAIRSTGNHLRSSSQSPLTSSSGIPSSFFTSSDSGLMRSMLASFLSSQRPFVRGRA